MRLAILYHGYFDVVTLFCPKIPKSPDLFLILPPVIVPRMDVFFSEGVPMGVPGLMLPEVVSRDDKSSNGISPGGKNPLLNFSITRAESWNKIRL